MTCFRPVFETLWPFVWRGDYDALLEANRELEELLQQAIKNDTPKDPVTGRYTSPRKGTFEVV
jgi:hypothetical protein